MKKWFSTLFCIAICNIISSQVHTYTLSEEIEFECDYSLIPPMNDFIENLIEYEIPLEILEGFKGAYISNKKIFNVRFADYNIETKSIRVAASVPEFLPTFKRAILYHEIAHHFMDDHNHVDGGPYLLQEGPKINIEYIIKNWEDVEREYFEFIKQKIK